MLRNIYICDGRGIHVLSGTTFGPAVTSRTYLYTPEMQLMAVTAPDEATIDYEIGWFAGRPVAQISSTGTRYTFADHLGTPIAQTGAGATVIWRAEYEPFGNIFKMRTGTRTDQPLRFPGQEVAFSWEGQEENYNIFRWYGSGCGRYTQADPLGVAGGMNLYGYVENNPINTYDPLGLMPVPKKDQKYRPCNSVESTKCAASCKYGMDTSVVQGKMVKKWVDSQLSCSCKEPDCLDKLKEWADPKKWLGPNPTPPLPLIPLVPPFTPTPAPTPVIPGLLPIFNPCYFGNFPGCGGDSGWT